MASSANWRLPGPRGFKRVRSASPCGAAGRFSHVRFQRDCARNKEGEKISVRGLRERGITCEADGIFGRAYAVIARYARVSLTALRDNAVRVCLKRVGRQCLCARNH